MKKIGKRILSTCLAVLTLMSCWVWMAPEQSEAAAAEAAKDHYLFAYFTGTSKEGQTIHLAVSEDGYNYTALRNNEACLVPSKGVGNVRDPYIWYNEQDNYYYILATDLDFTDTGSNYSNNSQSFIIWRSKDLVNWYDETFIDVSKMAHLIGDTRNMSAVWAPQVFWDGSAYVVYFTLNCNATGNMSLVYLKTSDLLDQNSYYEYGVLFDPGYNVIDADIIKNPNDGLYYLFYKNEDWDYDTPTTDLKTIHYLMSENATGPYTTTHPTTGASIDTNSDGRGYRVYPNVTVSLEGCNSYFDNEGYLVTYTDEYGHKNALGEDEAYFHISRTKDFKTFTMLDDSIHNINSLSPRHGSVVKITEEEYNRLLNNSYSIKSSSYSEDETLKDHLVGQFFTTDDPAYNAVVGQPNLTVTGIDMGSDGTYGTYANFNGSTSYAEIDFDSLFLKTNGLNYHDGFTITFSAWNRPMENENSENNDRIYEIANIFGDETSENAYYTNFSPSGGGTGSYLQAYNGPVKAGVNYRDWLPDKDGSNRDDDCIHEYIISYATGNIMVYVDGELVISANRFTTKAPLDDSWYKALGTEATMRIGKSGWDADPLFDGLIQDLCIYDCSMSYYDIETLKAEERAEKGFPDDWDYNGITSVVPTFNTYTTAYPGILYNNILYSSSLSELPEGSGKDKNPTSGTNPAVVWENVADCYFGVYYAETTVLLLDGKNSAIMPVFFAGRQNTNGKDRYVYNVYPTDAVGSNNDNTEINLRNDVYGNRWKGWANEPNAETCVTTGNNVTLGSAKGMSGYCLEMQDANSQDGRAVRYVVNALKVDENNIDFEGKYYKNINLPWQYYGGSSTTYTENDANLKGNKISDNDIYVIDFRPILEYREKITEDAYNEIMNNEALCPALREKYANAVYKIQSLDPDNFGFAEAPVTATKALGKAIGEAISTYDGVLAEIERQKTAGTYGHSVATFAARKATCTTNGLTEGKYCVLCGEILEEQQLIATLPHTFGDIFTENGIEYKECSVCGERIEYKPYELRYENLFALNRWDDSASKGVANGTVSTNLANGTITIVNNHTTEVFTRATFDGQNLVATRDFGNDCIPVEGNRTYVVEATNLASSTSQGEVFAFQYTKDGLVYSQALSFYIEPGETKHMEVTVDSNAAYIELRFDANDAGKTITYSNIGVYEKEHFDRFGSETENSRLAFYPGNDIKLTYPNPSDGYSFDGWYTVAGKKIENVNQLNNPSTLVYGKWIPAGYNVVYDSIFSFSSWAKSSCNQLWYGDTHALETDGSKGEYIGPRLVSYEGIVADAENGTIKITWDADNKSYADTENGTYIQYCARTNLHNSPENLYKIAVEPNTDYIIEYTASSTDNGLPNVCAYMPKAGTDANGVSMTAQESGRSTRYGLGTQYFEINTYASTELTLRFDNVQIGSTVTYSDIAVYKADTFQDHAMNITNREYLRYYPTKLGIGDVFEYTPTRPGYTFETWYADVDGTVDGNGDYQMKGFDDTFLIEQNWHLYSQWNENSYTVKFNANGGTGTIADQTIKYTEDVTLPSAGITRKGYTLKGWSTVQNATSALYQAGQTGVNRLNGDPNGTTTLYAVWWNNVYNMTFDNLIDFDAWNKTTANDATISDVTDTGFTLTSNEGVGEGKSKSPFFAVTAGKQYKIDIDITGTNWDVYIFFYDDTQSGNGIAFDDSKNRYSANGGGNQTQIFTAPSGATCAAIRVDSNGSGNAVTFDNIRVYEYELNPIIGYDYRYLGATYDEAYPDTFVPIREGYTFNGWYNSGTQYYTNEAKPTKDLFQHDYTFKLFSQWQLNNESLTPDSYVADFGATIKVDPIKNDQIFLNEATNSNSSYTVSVDTSVASASSNIISYKPSSIFNEITEIPYSAQLAQGDYSANKVSNTISVIPASNILYEENVLTTGTTGKAQWDISGTVGTTAQTDNSVYGYDALYNNANDYSNGSAKKTTVSSSNNRSDTLTFTFTGTGFELFGACGTNTGIQIINVKKDGVTKKAAVVDTYYSDSDYGTLYQTPIYNVSGLDYGTYTVEITAAYLPSISGALKQSTLADEGSATYDLVGALSDVGLDYILEADDIDVEWFDDNSILNGGTGANDPTAFGTYADMPLENYVDAVRVFQPLENGDDYYIATEKKARYYNINDNLMSASNFITGGEGFVYVENSGMQIGATDYNKKGSKHEIYLANDDKQSLVFSVANTGDYSRVMLSLRAAYGNPTVKIGEKTITVNSKTEMYYDITDCVAADGTVTIQNTAADSLLSVGYLKLTGDATFETTSDLSTAIDMIETPIDIEDTEAGSIINVEYTPSTDSHNSFDVTVNGRPAMIQFIEEDGGTRTYDRNNKNVDIKSYNADGVQVNSLDRTVAYEVWTINTNLTGPDVKVRAKYLADGAYTWEKNHYSFTYEILEPELDADVREITPSAVSGKKGAVSVKVVTGPDAEGIRFVMPDGSTCTYYAAKAVTLENGDLEFTGNAWMNEDGENLIKVYVRENGTWTEAGEISYTAE